MPMMKSVALIAAVLLQHVGAQTPEDTYIWQSAPNTNYGSASSITVDQSDGNAGTPTRGLVKFNGISIPAGYGLDSATLKINSVNPTSGTVSAFRMLEPWSDSSTWSTLNNGNPSRETTPSFLIPAPSSGVVLEFDVTSDVAGWIDAPSTNEGWIFISDSTNGWDFTSAESSNPPELVLSTTKLIEDTYIWEGSPGSSYGSEDEITVDDVDSGYPTRGLLKFNNLSIEPGQFIESATLKINSVNPTSGTISAYRMIDSWSETSTWSQLSNGNPARAATTSFEIDAPSSGVVLEFDVTSDVEGWLQSPSTNQGWIFISDSSNGWDFTTSESSNPPELVITTSSVPMPTPVDTYIWGGSVGSSYGSDTSISVDESDGGYPSRGLIKFTGIVVPAGRSLDSATLKINSINPTSGTVSAYRMLTPWNDTSSWSQLNNGNPARLSTPSFEVISPSSGVVLEFDVTSDVQAWLANTTVNQGWFFLSDSTDGWDFTSAESSNPPQLILATSPDDGVDPTPAPVGPVPMCPNGPATYHPGDLTVTLDDSLSTGSLLVSTGLNGRVLTRDG